MSESHQRIEPSLSYDDNNRVMEDELAAFRASSRRSRRQTLPDLAPFNAKQLLSTAPDSNFDRSTTGIVSIIPARKCVSAACVQDEAMSGWGTTHACYSPTCPRSALPPYVKPKRSYWRHPKIKMMLLRAKICCSFDTLGIHFRSFAPRMLHEYIKRLVKDGKQSRPEFGEVLHGAVLFADASGFTALTSRLSAESNGAEKLCHILNDFFEKLVGIVHSFGGDVIKFAGDAITVIWRIRENGGGPASMQEAAQCASRCACAIHKKLHKFPAVGGSDPVFLSMHIGVGCGMMTCIHVGGVFDRWEFVVGGPPMTQIAYAEPAALPGETVVSPSVWEHTKLIAVGVVLEDLVSDTRKIRSEALKYVRIDELMDSNVNTKVYHLEMSIKAKDFEYLKRYIPAAVHKRLEAGHDAYIAEIRPVSIVFILIDGVKLEAEILEDGTPDCSKAIDFGQEMMLKVQEVIYQHEGSMNKMMIDDKGQVILCVFGLNPYFHHDDPLRAVKASNALVERLSQLRKSVTVSIGVASGKSFCGVVGSKTRREYTVMGPMVNLAARLMCAAAPGTVLIDETTQNNVISRSIQFKQMPSLSLKGFTGKQNCYQPIKISEPKGTEHQSKSADLALAFREDELEKVDSILRSVDIQGVLLVIVGDYGSGKQAVTQATIKRGEQNGLTVFNASKGPTKKKSMNDLTSAYAKSEPPKQHFDSPKFYTWSGIFRTMLALRADEKKCSPEDIIREVLVGFHHIELLCIVLPEYKNLGLAQEPQEEEVDETPVTPGSNTQSILEETSYWNLSASQRVNALIAMLSKLLEYFSSTVPTLVVLHLKTGTSSTNIADPESWQLALHVAETLIKNRSVDLPKLVMCLVSRPSVYYSPDEYVQLEKMAASKRTLLILNPMTEQQRGEYLARVLGVSLSDIPEVLVKFMSDFGAGNPKHIEEILSVLGEQMFEINDKRVILTEAMKHPDAVEHLYEKLPQKTKSIALTMLEKLQPSNSLVIKFASMWDLPFTDLMLRDVIPLEAERKNLDEILTGLVQSGILYETKNIPEYLREYHPESTPRGAFFFVSKVLQRTASALLLAEHRQELDARRASLEGNRDKHKLMLTLSKKMAHWLGLEPTRRLPVLSDVSPKRRTGMEPTDSSHRQQALADRTVHYGFKSGVNQLISSEMKWDQRRRSDPDPDVKPRQNCHRASSMDAGVLMNFDSTENSGDRKLTTAPEPPDTSDDVNISSSSSSSDQRTGTTTPPHTATATYTDTATAPGDIPQIYVCSTHPSQRTARTTPDLISNSNIHTIAFNKQLAKATSSTTTIATTTTVSPLQSSVPRTPLSPPPTTDQDSVFEHVENEVTPARKENTPARTEEKPAPQICKATSPVTDDDDDNDLEWEIAIDNNMQPQSPPLPIISEVSSSTPPSDPQCSTSQAQDGVTRQLQQQDGVTLQHHLQEHASASPPVGNVSVTLSSPPTLSSPTSALTRTHFPTTTTTTTTTTTAVTPSPYYHTPSQLRGSSLTPKQLSKSTRWSRRLSVDGVSNNHRHTRIRQKGKVPTAMLHVSSQLRIAHHTLCCERSRVRELESKLSEATAEINRLTQLIAHVPPPPVQKTVTPKQGRRFWQSGSSTSTA